jgi:selenocysteine-specific elongation factor
MATVTFWGAQELVEQQQQQSKKEDGNKNIQPNLDGSALGGDADRAGLPYLQFDWNQDFLQQDSVLESLNDPTLNHEGEESIVTTTTATTPSSSSTTTSSPLLHWAVLDFQTPVYCPLNSLIIGSRLDTVVETKASHAGASTDTSAAATSTTNTASSCRLAFCGRLVTQMDPSQDMSRIRWYTPKERRGTVSRLGDPHERQDDGKLVRYEIFGSDLFKKETVLKPFLGMKMVTPQGDIGELKGGFGTAGKFRVYFPAGTTVREGESLVMPFKRFIHDAEKKMRQDDWILPKARPGTRIETVSTKKKKSNTKPDATGQVEKLKGDPLDNGKFPQAIIAGFFQPQDDIRERIGQVVRIPSTNETGTIAGAFGKAGKCKVAFESGISAEPGVKAELLPRQP